MELKRTGERLTAEQAAHDIDQVLQVVESVAMPENSRSKTREQLVPIRISPFKLSNGRSVCDALELLSYVRRKNR
jgi:hypothetical protein